MLPLMTSSLLLLLVLGFLLLLLLPLLLLARAALAAARSASRWIVPSMPAVRRTVDMSSGEVSTPPLVRTAQRRRKEASSGPEAGPAFLGFAGREVVVAVEEVVVEVVEAAAAAAVAVDRRCLSPFPSRCDGEACEVLALPLPAPSAVAPALAPFACFPCCLDGIFEVGLVVPLAGATFATFMVLLLLRTDEDEEAARAVTLKRSGRVVDADADEDAADEEDARRMRRPQPPVMNTAADAIYLFFLCWWFE